MAWLKTCLRYFSLFNSFCKEFCWFLLLLVCLFIVFICFKVFVVSLSFFHLFVFSLSFQAVPEMTEKL